MKVQQRGMVYCDKELLQYATNTLIVTIFEKA